MILKNVNLNAIKIQFFKGCRYLLVSNNISFRKKGLKYFIGYKENEKSGYVKRFDETKFMSFLVKDYELLQKYNKIWDKVSNIIKKDLIVNLYTIKNI